MINVELYINDTRVDLYGDERISLNLSVKNFQNIDKVFNDFTQSFTIPASPTNNAILEHWFDKSVTLTYNPAVKIPARIELNSLPFRKGLIAINKAVVKDGRIDYYNVTFYGGNSNLNQLFGDDYLNQLDLSAYDLAWSSFPTALGARVLSNNVLIPLISSTRNWLYNDDNDANSIKYLDTASTAIKYDELKGAITLTAIIDAIEAKYGITINSTFFSSTEFGRLFMWANRTAGNTRNYAGDFVKPVDGVLSPAPSATVYDAVNDWWLLNNSNTTPLQVVTYTIWGGIEDNEKETEILIVDANNDDEIIHRRTYTNLFFEDTFEVIAPDTGEPEKQIYMAVRCGERDDTQFNFTMFNGAGFDVNYTDSSNSFDVVDFKFTDSVSSADPITGETRTYKGNLPNQTVNEFLGGIVKMFNLVITPVSETEFNIEPLDDFYAAGSDLDLGKYIKSSEYSIEPASLFGEINFKYTPSNTVLSKNFRETNDEGYGDLRTVITDSNGDPISKQSFNLELPFVNLIWEKLTDTTSTNNPVTNVMVAKSIDTQLDPITEKPYIFYYVGAEGITSTPVAYKNVDFGNASSLTTYNLCYQFNSRTSYTFSLNFGSEINPYSLQDGTVSSASLYNDYWSDYITDLYNVAQRRYTFNGVLPQNILIDLELNANLVIGFNKYRINSMQVDLTTGEATLDLINIIA